MAKKKSKTPLLDQLEAGPWPSFVKEMKRAAEKSPAAEDLMGQLELSYKEKVVHWKHGGIVGVRGYGGGVIERYCDVPVLGCIPRSPDMELPQRHLGLVPCGEMDGAALVVEKAHNIVEANLDLDRLLSIARGSDNPGDSSGGLHRRDAEFAEEDHGGKSVVAGFSLRGRVPDKQGGTDVEDHAAQLDRFRRLKPAATHQTGAATRQPDSVSPREARIGVLRDRVFSFYYPENLEALAEAGAELVLIDSLQADRLPALDALYIGGGFPELFLDELEANDDLRHDIAARINEGLPVYAECAGLMYLSQGIVSGGRRREMVGALPCEIEMSARPVGHGYAVVETVKANPLFAVGHVVRGHEFHHARVVDASALDCAYRVRRGFGVDGQLDGIVYKNVFASFTHLHALGTPEWAPAFVQCAKTASLLP